MSQMPQQPSVAAMEWARRVIGDRPIPPEILKKPHAVLLPSISSK